MYDSGINGNRRYLWCEERNEAQEEDEVRFWM